MQKKILECTAIQHFPIRQGYYGAIQIYYTPLYIQYKEDRSCVTVGSSVHVTSAEGHTVPEININTKSSAKCQEHHIQQSAS